jgi:hypothetical protein
MMHTPCKEINAKFMPSVHSQRCAADICSMLENQQHRRAGGISHVTKHMWSRMRQKLLIHWQERLDSEHITHQCNDANRLPECRKQTTSVLYIPVPPGTCCLSSRCYSTAVTSAVRTTARHMHVAPLQTHCAQ